MINFGIKKGNLRVTKYNFNHNHPVMRKLYSLMEKTGC